MRKLGRAAATLAKAEWLIGMANASFRDRAIADITIREVLSGLELKELAGTLRDNKAPPRPSFPAGSGTPSPRTRAETDPTFALRGALAKHIPTPRAAIIDLEPRTLMQSVAAYAGQPTKKAVLKLLALPTSRPGELRRARWSEFDLRKGVWTIPAERMKMRRAHRVPLPAVI